MLLADGFDEAIIGYIDRTNEPRVVVYDREKCIDIILRDILSPTLCNRESWERCSCSNRDEAEEYFEYNVAGSYMGAETPAYLNRADIGTIHELADA